VWKRKFNILEGRRKKKEARRKRQEARRKILLKKIENRI
jgi:hypothetical protein